MSNLRSNHRFDVHRPFPPLICFLQIHKTTTAMTTRQFSGLLSIPNVWLALSFCDFFVQCQTFAVMSAKGCAPLITCIYKVENGQLIIFRNPKSQDSKVMCWPGSGASNHSYHTTLRPRISISHVVQLLQRK